MDLGAENGRKEHKTAFTTKYPLSRKYHILIRVSPDASFANAVLSEVCIEIYLVNLRHVVTHIEQDGLLSRVIYAGPVGGISV